MLRIPVRLTLVVRPSVFDPLTHSLGPAPKNKYDHINKINIRANLRTTFHSSLGRLFWISSHRYTIISYCLIQARQHLQRGHFNFNSWIVFRIRLAQDIIFASRAHNKFKQSHYRHISTDNCIRGVSRKSVASDFLRKVVWEFRCSNTRFVFHRVRSDICHPINCRVASGAFSSPKNKKCKLT
jgi:hypothetical protein